MALPSTLQLGGLSLASPFLLAPLESVSDAPFRRLCWELGAGLTFTEMIRARGIARNNASTLDLIDSHDADVPTGLQLMVANEKELVEALEKVEALAATTHPRFRNLVAVDLNFGCPSPEVIRIGAGPALLKRRSKVRAIFEALRDWKSKTTLPVKAVSAKIRLGINRRELDEKVYLGVVEAANDTLDFLTVHARHGRQDSTEAPWWDAIGEVKARAKLPIIANGDVFSRADAERLHAQTGCDGFLIARGAIRSPWIFCELRAAGPGLPSADELTAAETRYFADAERLGSKLKYREWHREGFRRLRARIEGKPVSGPALPANEHMR